MNNSNGMQFSSSNKNNVTMVISLIALKTMPSIGKRLEIEWRLLVASITIRNLEDEVKRRLRIQAATKGHSMEEEARRILRVALGYAS